MRCIVNLVDNFSITSNIVSRLDLFATAQSDARSGLSFSENVVGFNEILLSDFQKSNDVHRTVLLENV